MEESQFLFDPKRFRPISLADQEEIFPILRASSAKSCEFAFGNLYSWKTHTGLLWQKAFGRLYFYYEDVDKLAFSVGEEEASYPSPEELAAVSSSMKKELGASGDYFVVPTSVVEKGSKEEWEKFFSIAPAPDDELEYIYKLQDLLKLPGKQLAKKRNLISQFHKNFPSAILEEIGKENLSAIAGLAAEWAKEHLHHELEAHEEIYMEQKAIELALESFSSLHARGVLLKNEGKPIAFAVGYPITDKIWAEPFEKALPNYKGASQTILQALADLLQKEGCQFLNREQDMGLEGLRKAKRSYQPEELLLTYHLHYRQ